MKVKLDEHVGTAGAEFLKAAGFDVATVAQQQLTSAPDEDLVNICAAEDRCFVMLDKDFSDPIRNPPRNYADDRRPAYVTDAPARREANQGMCRLRVLVLIAAVLASTLSPTVLTAQETSARPLVELEKSRYVLGERVVFWVGVTVPDGQPVPASLHGTGRIVLTRPDGAEPESQRSQALLVVAGTRAEQLRAQQS